MLTDSPERFLLSSTICPPTPSSNPKWTQYVLTYVPASHLSQTIPKIQDKKSSKIYQKKN